MQYYKSRKDDRLLQEAYTTIVEGSKPFDAAVFTDALKSAARFIKDGELSTLGTGGIQAVLSRFHMDAAAKKEAASILQQQATQLFPPGVSSETLDKIMQLVTHNQGQDVGLGSASTKHAMRLSAKPTKDDYMHNPEASSSQHNPSPASIPGWRSMSSGIR